MVESTQRFSNRVADYVRYRPGYPVEVIEILREQCALDHESVVADIGSGPGNLTRIMLAMGCQVAAVEPNREMREAGEALLASFPNFRSIDGSAENTNLEAAKYDLVTAAQAFHWFDREKAKAEFRRILRPNGWIALIWNSRQVAGSPFLEGYENALREHAPEYAHVNHREIAESEIQAFFDRDQAKFTFPNRQAMDRDGFLGRVMSSSYVPAFGQPGHTEIVDECNRLFDAFAEKDAVSFEYITEVFIGRLL